MTYTFTGFSLEPQETNSDGQVGIEPNEITVNEQWRVKLDSD